MTPMLLLSFSLIKNIRGASKVTTEHMNPCSGRGPPDLPVISRAEYDGPLYNTDDTREQILDMTRAAI